MIASTQQTDASAYPFVNNRPSSKTSTRALSKASIKALAMTEADENDENGAENGEENEEENEEENGEEIAVKKTRSKSVASTIAPLSRARLMSLKPISFKKTPLISPRTPQFLTVSPMYSSRSRSPSPFARTRHSIDVRTLPSYLAKKRQSVFGSKLFETLVEVATSPFQEEDNGEPIFEEPEAPTLSLGERVAWVKTSGPEFGTVRWIGRMPQVSPQWTVGVEFDNAIGTGDGRFDGRRYFIAKENFARFLPLSALTKVDNYVGRPRSGTMLSRMSVQLKPGQMISVQRTPSINRISTLHCALNAPHHIDHDVHKPNVNHCLCNNCNHPCAHLCRTRRRKGSKGEVAHMCHFSHKPHNKMCCGGEDLIYNSNRKPFGLVNSNHDNFNSDAKKSKTNTRRKSTRNEEACKPSSAPTSVERKREEILTPIKHRSGSEISISSLPSTSSPVEVYIARGALTDESELETEIDVEPHENGISEKRSGLRSLVSCLVPGMSSKKKRKERLHKSEGGKKKRKQFTLTTSSCSSRSQSRGDQKHRGLSTSPEADESYCSYCHNSSSRAASASPSRFLTETLKLQPKGISVSTLTDPVPELEEAEASETTRPKSAVSTIPETNETNGGSCDNGSTKSSSKSSGRLITTFAEVEIRSPSVQSDGSNAMSPRRKKKGPAPAPPSPTSPNPSQSSTASIASPTSVSPSATGSGNSKRKKSIKTKPAPTPPPLKAPLKRSMSEQKQLSARDVLNAVPSYCSEVNLKTASKRTNQTLESDSLIINYDECDYIPKFVEVPDQNEPLVHQLCTSLCDASVQADLEESRACFDEGLLVYENLCICKTCGCNLYKESNTKSKSLPDGESVEPPELPRKTFDALAFFGCDFQSINYEDSKFNLLSFNNRRSFSLPHSLGIKCSNDISEAEIFEEIIYENMQVGQISGDLQALLSPKHKKYFSNDKDVRRFKSDDISNDNPSALLDFIQNIADLENSDKQNEKIPDKNSTESDLSEGIVTVKSMPTKWKYSSSSNGSEFSVSNNVTQRMVDNQLQSSMSGLDVFQKTKVDKTKYKNKATSTSSMSSSSFSSISCSTPQFLYADKKSVSISSHDFGKPPLNPKNECAKSGESDGSSHLGRGVRKRFSKECLRNKVVPKQTIKNNFNEMCSPGTSGFQNSKNFAIPFNGETENEMQSLRLMQQLELAIARGQHRKAAILARELALRKVTFTLNHSKQPEDDSFQPIIVYLYIEDKLKHKGPIPIQVNSNMTLRMLKLKIEKDFGYPLHTQKWIFGKSFATNEEASLATYGITASGCPIFLYILSTSIEATNEKANDDRDFSSNDDIEKSKQNFTMNGLPDDATQSAGETSETGDEEDDSDESESDSDFESVDNDSDASNSVESASNDIAEPENANSLQKTYRELVELDDKDCVANVEPFECVICLSEIAVGNGVVLRDCLHSFCRDCLRDAIHYTEEAVVKCPFRNHEYSCDSCLQDREVKAVASPELYERYLHRSVASAESKSTKSFHCKTADCRGWCEYDDNVNTFPCPVCGHENCLTCQAIHENMNCKQYQDQIDLEAAENEDAKKTKEYLDNMLTAGDAVRCPQCMVIVMKKWGCDWVKCSMCQTEICWVTKGPRWGPAGRGDTSAGCKCMVNGVKCHPKCNYCH